MSSLISAAFAIILAFQAHVAAFDPNPPPQIIYIVNTNTDKFHDPECKYADSIKEKNRWEYTGPREDLIYFKYVPCKVCNP